MKKLLFWFVVAVCVQSVLAIAGDPVCVSPQIMNNAHTACIGAGAIDWSLVETPPLLLAIAFPFAVFMGIRAGLSA